MPRNANRGQATSFTPGQVSAMCSLFQRFMLDGPRHYRENPDVMSVHRKFLAMRDRMNEKRAVENSNGAEVIPIAGGT